MRLVLGIVLSSLLTTAPLTAQQLTGGVSGSVTDSQGGALPGVTVTLTSPALIGGGQTTVSGEAGTYQFTGLPPGMYTVTFELPGFSSLVREAIRVQVAQSTRIDANLTVGSIEEAITVSGQAPVVDVTTTTSQTNIDKEFSEAIPTSNNPWVMAALVPGVVAQRLDVGGTEGMQQYNLQAYGSSDSQKSFSVDGVKMNWSGGSGGSANQYYSNEMFDEYNMQTASGTAESDVSGVYMNMVTRSGGNQLSGNYNILFMNDAMQGDNVDDDLLRRLGAQPGQQIDAAGNPTDIMLDTSATIGGAIKQDKVWFFGSIRYYRLDQFQIGAVNPDGSLGIDDNLARAGMAKVTYQADPSTRMSFLVIPHVRDRYHRRNAPFLAIPDKAAIHNILDTDSLVAGFNRVFGNATVLNVSLGRVWGRWANLYQKDVTPNDIVVSDTVRNQRFNASLTQEVNPNSRLQVNTTLSYFNSGLLGGTNNFKFGFQRSMDVMDWERIRNGDMQLELRDGVPFRALLSNTPNNADQRWNTWGVFAQDQWRASRVTLNLGVRFDGITAYLPAQTSPAGAWVEARSFPRTEIFKFSNVAPRLGAVIDLFGDGQTALKAYYGRFYDQFGAQIPEAVNSNNVTTVQVPWTDLNGNLTYDPGELDLSGFTGFPAGLFPVVTDDARRPRSDEISFGVDRQLPYDLGISISYHRRMHRDGLTIVDRARPASAYTPVERTYVDGGETKTITVYDLDPALRTVRDRTITNAAILKSDYDGIDISLTKKLSSRWQMLGGVTFSRHEGFDHAGTFTNPGNSTDLNNPNYVMNRDNGAVFIDLPWTFKLAGSYMLPYDVVIAGKLNARSGDPLARTLVVTGLSQGSETVNVQQRGVDRTETVSNFIDFRVSKRFSVRPWQFEAAFDVYNVLNANPVLAQNESLGSTHGRPQTILAPRLLRLNLTARF